MSNAKRKVCVSSKEGGIRVGHVAGFTKERSDLDQQVAAMSHLSLQIHWLPLHPALDPLVPSPCCPESWEEAFYFQK